MLENPEEFEEFCAHVYGGTQLSAEEIEEIQAEDAAIAKIAEKKIGKNSKKKDAKKTDDVATEALVEAIEQEEVG